MKALLSIFSFIAILCSISCSNNTTVDIVDLNPVEFKTALEKEKGILIDVRTPEEYIQGHIPGSATINFYDDSFKAKLNSIQKDETLFIYCAAGGRSSKAAAMSLELGFAKVYNLSGGIGAWEEQGLEISR
jgi:rhodanese-related sulfurtransferase